MNDTIIISGDGDVRELIDGDPAAIYERSINEHNKLTNRDYPDQHPISAITGLQEALDSVTVEEVDPTVPAWAKQPTKPSYTAAEVGALPDDTEIPTKTSDLQNDSGFITGYTETDPTVPAWAKASSKPTYTAQEVGALPADTVIPTVPTNVSAFNNDAGYLTSYTETDPTVPSWAKAANKPSYTAQEVGALPASTVIPTVPTNVSAFTNDAGYLTSYTETDPTVPSWAKQPNKPTYTASEVGALPSTYTAPVTSVNGRTGAVTLTIPTVPTAVSAFTNDAGYLTLATLPVYDGSVI